LGDHVDLQTGFPFKSADFTEDPLDVRLVRGDNVVQGRFRWDGVRRWPRTKLDAYRDYLLEPGDVILAMDRPWIEAGLKYSAVSPEDLPCLLVQRVSRMRGINGLSTRFLRYVIGSPAFTEHVLAVQTGTAVPHISSRQITDFRFTLPPIAEQERVADVLGALDDKIELNRRMNRTLESIAHAIFKSWFVDFDPVRKKMEGKTGGELGLPPSLAALFPDQLDPSTDAPEGWPVTSLGQLVTASRRTVTPAEMADQVVDHYSIPAFDDGRMPTVAEGSAIKSNKFLVEDGIVLVSRLNPRIPRVWFPRPRGRRCVCSTEYLVLSPEPQVTPEFIYGLLCSESFGDELVSRVTGTSGSHQRVKPGDALSIQVVLPPPPAIEQFSEVTAPLLRRAGHCLDESERLASVRDALLPRLLGGSFRGHDGRVSRGEVAP
jgi:type I restriction enzyme S subunit